jgi:gamma-glutamylcyclotransferase (GGCT)/AIG2-like uncharacterized protein YtfP
MLPGTRSGSGDSSGTLLFVYGTLKSGFTNWRRYLSLAEDHGAARLVALGRTHETFPLVVRPASMLPATCGPVLMDQPGRGQQVSGELWLIDERTLEAMDELEGVKRGYYYRRSVSVSLLPSLLQGLCDGYLRSLCDAAGNVESVAYFYPSQPTLLDLDTISEYTIAEHAQYQPGPVDETIAALCRPPAGSPTSIQPDAYDLAEVVPVSSQAECVPAQPGGQLPKARERPAPPPPALRSHGLQTSRPHPMRVHALRLLPGEDLLR